MVAGTGNDGATEVISLRALLGREGMLPPARAAAIIASLAGQLDAVPPSDPVYGSIGLDTISVATAAGQPDQVHVAAWDLGGAVAAEGATTQARALAAQRSLASVATALLAGRQPEAFELAADLVRAIGLPPAAGVILDRALGKKEEGEGFDRLTEFATALARALQPAPPGAGQPAGQRQARRRASLAASAWTAWRALPPAGKRQAVAAVTVVIVVLAISLPLALAGSPGLNERAWQGWPGAPAVGTLKASPGTELQGTIFNSTSALAVSPDGSRLLIVDGTGGVTEWDLRSNAARRLPALASFARAVKTTLFGLAISPDLTTLAAADVTDVFTEQAATGRQLGDARFSFGSNLMAFGQPGVAFSPDGRLLAYNDSDGKVYLLNVATQQQQEVLHPSHAPSSYQASGTDAFAFSPDGDTLAAGTEDGTIYLWSLRSGELLATLTDPNSSPGDQYPDVNALAFGEHGALLVAANLYGTVSVWSVAGRHLLGVLPGTPASQHASAEHVAFSPDGGLLAAYFDDDSIRVWSVATGRPLAVLANANGNGSGPIAFALGGRLLVILGGLGAAREWNLARS
jgi:hypothetical protein